MKKRLSFLASLLLLTGSAWAGITSGGTHFLYNVGAQKWLNFGSEKGQAATFYKHGTPITITQTEGGYTLQAPFYDANNYLTGSGLVGAATDLTITEVGEGLYTIGSASGLLGYDGTTDLNAAPFSTKTVSCNLSEDAGNNAKWQIFTKEEMIEALKAESNDVKDATFMIQSPNFHRHDAGCYNTAPNGKLVWTGLEASNHGYAAGYEADYCGFVFNTGGVNIYQDITGLPAGMYEVRVQGFSRYGSNTDATGSYAGSTPQATFFAGEESTPLMKLTDDLAASGFYANNKKYSDGYVPYFNNDGGKTTSNSNVEACKAFDYGMFNKNTLRVTVGGDGTLRIGINVPADARTNTWTAFDNFELKYLGAIAVVTDEMKAEILASVPSGKMNAQLTAALSQALEAFNADVTVENYNALSAAISEAKASEKIYAEVRTALDKAYTTDLKPEVLDQLKEVLSGIEEAYEKGTLEGSAELELGAIEDAVKAAIIENSADSDDKTSLIVNPQFNDGKTGWSGDFGSGAVKATDTNPLITAYGGTFNVYQDVKGLKNGTYKLQVQAFTRPMDHNDMKTAIANGESLGNETYFYGNESEKLVKLINEEYNTTGAWGADFGGGKYVPNSSGDAAKAFLAGMYENELLCVVTDGTLRIGIRQEATSGTPYVGYDNFRLTYVSADTTLPEEEKPALKREDVMAFVENCNKVAAQAVDHSAFDAAYQSCKDLLNASELSEEALLQVKAQATAALADLLKTGETASGQFDLTPLIANATFNANLDGWEATKPFVWNSTGVVQATNSQKGGQLTQLLSGMPAGKYTLKVQGFYRQSGWKEGLYEYEHGNKVEKLNLVLNDAQKPVKSLFEDGRASLASANISRTEDVGSTIDGRGFPHLMSKVQDVFTPGNYWNWLEVELTEDGDVTFGVRLDETDLQDNWLVLDNFRLYYGQRKPVVLTRTNYSVKDDTPAEVKIVKTVKADEMVSFSAPCDIPGSLFKAVYEIGKLDYSTKTMTLFPVENVRAGVPCCVVFAADADTLFVGQTVIRAAQPDAMELPWDGGLIEPVANTFNWQSYDLTNTKRLSGLYRNVEILDLNDLQFNANIENYQVRRFLSAKYSQTSESVISNYNQPSPSRRDIAHSVGIPVPAGKSEGAVVRYSLNEDMSEAKTLNVNYGATMCYIPNLIPNTQYYFEVAQGEAVAVKGQFTTEGPLRQLYAPSVYNIRDFGGWKMQDGSVTRYGLIYRGGEVNGFHAPYQKDVETLKELGIGAEIDLRYNDSYDQDRETNKSGFGFKHGDTYYFAGANDYTAANLDEAGTQARLKEEFRFLMGHIREGRGVYFHCVFGADRTGFFAVLLEGLLGFNLNDLYHDYEFTSFAAPAGNRNKNSIQERIAVIQKRTGKTLRDKFEDYWLNAVGITAEEVEEFRSIMLHNPVPVGIQDIIPEEDAEAGIQAVYTMSGTKMPQNATSKSGIYIVQGKDGAGRKVIVK